MKNKDLKKLALQIYTAEMNLQHATNPEEIQKCKTEIMQLTRKVDSLEEMCILDDMIRKIIKNKGDTNNG